MVISLTPELEQALSEQAKQLGIAPELLVLDTLQNQFIQKWQPVEPQDDWEQKLFGAVIDCGVSIPDSALSRDALYE